MPVQKANGHSLWPNWSCISLLSLPHQVWKVPCTRQNSSPPSLSASRFLGAGLTSPFLTSLEGPRHPGCDDTITNQGSVAEHRALSVKSSSYETKVGLGPQLPLDSKTHYIPVVRDTSTIMCFPQVLSEWFIFFHIFYSILWLLYWYQKPSIKIWPILQSIHVIRNCKPTFDTNFVLSYLENCDMLILIIKILFYSGHRIVCYANHKILFKKIKL